MNNSISIDNAMYIIITFYYIYRLLNPVLKRLDKSKQKELEAQIQKQFDPVEVNITNFNKIIHKKNVNLL